MVFPNPIMMLMIAAFLFSIMPLQSVGNTFNPFMDSNLFAIKWLGPLELNQDEINTLGERHLVVTTDKRETYHCILPESESPYSDDRSKYDGPDVDTIMAPLLKSKQCSYRIESYWTYELCHGKQLRQFHETREQGAKPKIQQYFLGTGNSRAAKNEETSSSVKEHDTSVNEDPKPTSDEKASQEQSVDLSSSSSNKQEGALPTRDFDGVPLPYYEVVMDGGTKCDLTGRPRKARVLYICQSEGRGEIYEFKESSTCEYEVVVLIGLLCHHPDYRPKTQPVSEIRCHSYLGSPIKPAQLYGIEREVQYLQNAPRRYQTPAQQEEAEEEEAAGSGSEKVQAEQNRKQTLFKETEADKQAAEKLKQRESDPQAEIGSITDRLTLKNILSGSQCLLGGSGWWKHEVCIGKFAKQFHKDKQVDVNIYLGHWDKQKHLEWLNENPHKRPRPAEERKFVSLFYSNGDVCDLTGAPRSCEVRLKCLPNIKNKHAVILSLAEPASCQYVLTVESALFCDAVKHADVNGLFDNVEF